MAKKATTTATKAKAEPTTKKATPAKTKKTAAPADKSAPEQTPEVKILEGANDQGKVTSSLTATSELENLTVDAPLPERRIVLVIPYLHSAAKGDELLYALRAWEKNFDRKFDLVIIGDKPDFLADEVLHIPTLQLAQNPQLDMAAKLMQAIASDLVSDDFILSNDDIYPVNPITLADLMELRISGQLGETKKKAGSEYIAKIQRTKDILLAEGLTDYDFATHLPVVYNKLTLAEVIEKFNADKEGLLISSLYFNGILPPHAKPIVTRGNVDGDHVVYVYRANPSLPAIETAFEKRKFVNHNNDGYLPVLPFLKKAFPDKSKFEK